MNDARREIPRVAAALTVVCAIAGALLGAGYVATHRYREAADRSGERTAVLDLLQLDSAATLTEIRQYLDPARREVAYRSAPYGEPARREAVFAFDGRVIRTGALPAPGAGGDAVAERGLVPLGRLFAARRGDRPAGFVIEGETQGYKNKIRFFVGLTSGFEITGVRVVQHEEDPGLGAEVATSWFEGQYVGRSGAALAQLAVTRDPMPEDWRSALALLGRTSFTQWRSRHQALIAREGARPIYAVTGATISSRALTDGVRESVDHFRRRWELIAPILGGPS